MWGFDIPFFLLIIGPRQAPLARGWLVAVAEWTTTYGGPNQAGEQGKTHAHPVCGTKVPWVRYLTYRVPR